MKLNDELVERIVWRSEKGLGTRLLAEQFGVGQRRIQQILREYRKTDEIPKIRALGRRPYVQYPKNFDRLVLDLHQKYGLGGTYLARYLRKLGWKIDNNKVHWILLHNKMASSQPSKQKRKKPWIRYEREHSLSAGHMDWTTYQGKQCCVVLDDSSRKILAGVECDNATAEESIKLVQQVLDQYGHICRIREIITDHGTQFWASRRNPKTGNAEHLFEMFLATQGIKHLLCRIKHPQSNGKVERWFQEYKKHRNRYKTLKEFIDWYNNRPHGSLDLNTPEQIFWQRLKPDL